MDGVNLLAVAVVALSVLVLSTGYYVVFGKQLAQLSPAYADEEANARPPGWKIGVELLRNLVLAIVVARLAGSLDITELSGAFQLGLALWIGFPIVLWTGAVLWEKVPPKLAAIHAGDWLLKLLVITSVLVIWA